MAIAALMELLTRPEIGLVAARRILKCSRAYRIARKRAWFADSLLSLLSRNRIDLITTLITGCLACPMRDFNGHLRDIRVQRRCLSDTFSPYIRAVQITKVLPIVIIGCHAKRQKRIARLGIPRTKAVVVSPRINNVSLCISIFSRPIYCDTLHERAVRLLSCIIIRRVFILIICIPMISCPLIFLHIRQIFLKRRDIS